MEIIKPESKATSFWRRIKTEHKLLFFGTIIFLFIVGWISRPVTNLHYINSTNPYATPIPASSLKEIPQGYEQKLKYDINDEVPKNFIPSSLLVGYLFFVLLIVLVLTFKSEDIPDFMDFPIALKKAEHYWQSLKNMKLVNGDLFLYHEFPQGTLKHRELGGKNLPWTWVISGIYRYTSGNITPIILRINPINGKIMRATTTTKRFSRKDCCPECGQESDIKIIETEDYKRMRDWLKKTPIESESK